MTRERGLSRTLAAFPQGTPTKGGGKASVHCPYRKGSVCVGGVPEESWGDLGVAPTYLYLLRPTEHMGPSHGPKLTPVR